MNERQDDEHRLNEMTALADVIPHAMRDGEIPKISKEERDDMLRRAFAGEAVATPNETPWKPPEGPYRAWEDEELRKAVDNCDNCQGIGYVGHSVKVGHPLFGQLDICPVCDKYTRELRNREIARRLAPLVKKYSILPHLDPRTFSSYTIYHGNRDVLLAARRWVDGVLLRERAAPWLYVWGDNGNGKTHLATAAALSLQSNGLTVIFATMPDLKNMVAQDGFSHKDEIIYTLRTTPALILDDFGAEASTNYAKELAFNILDHRYYRKKPTLIVSNHHPTKPNGVYPSIKALEYYRLASRLHDRAVVHLVHNAADDYRLINQ